MVSKLLLLYNQHSPDTCSAFWKYKTAKTLPLGIICSILKINNATELACLSEITYDGLAIAAWEYN